MGLIDSVYNGATEIPGTSNDSLMVFLAGPIRYWWRPGVKGIRKHLVYMHAREKIHAILSEDFMVYAPHKAWRGPWNKLAQKVNWFALDLCDVLVVIDADVPAEGTDEETQWAQDAGMPVFFLHVGDDYDILAQLRTLTEQLKEIDKERRAHEQP